MTTSNLSGVPAARLPMPARAVTKVALVGSYPPRRCGIATFTRDLHDAIAQHLPARAIEVIAIDDLPAATPYSEEVTFRLRGEVRDDYRAAARHINKAGFDVVVLQHEFGIFGGDGGAYVLDLVAKLEAPLISTFHTVRRSPTSSQRKVMGALLASSSQIVVMSPSSIPCLERLHGALADKVQLIPHGVPNLLRIHPEAAKAQLGFGSLGLLLTFGLLSRDKGIEVVLDAMPDVLRCHPNIVYVVLGATHPSILRWEGEAYRQALHDQVARLHLGRHVIIDDRYVDLATLWHYLSAADIYVSPHVNPEQEVSGTLAFAMSAGNTIVATAYPCAREMVTDDIGRTVPFGDATALAGTLVKLLDEPCRIRRMQQVAYERTRAVTWANVGRRYLEVIGRLTPNTTDRLHA